MAPGLIDDAIAYVVNLIAQILTKLWEGIEWILQWVVSMLDNLMLVVWDMIQSVFTAVADALASMVTAIETVLTEIVEAVWAFLQDAWDQLYEATLGVLDSISNYIADLWASIEVFLADIIETVATWVETATRWVQDVVDAGLQAVADITAMAAQKLADFAAPLIASVQQALEGAWATINAAWEQLVLGAEAIIEGVNQKLVAIKEAFADAAMEVVTAIGDVSEEMLGPLRDTVTEFVTAYLPKDDPGATARAMAALEGIHTSPSSMAGYRAWWEGEWRSLAEAGPLRKTLFLGILFLLSIIPTIMGISQSLSQPTLQEYAKQFPYQILSPADATSAYRRELITRGEAIEQIRKAGFDERKAEDIVELTSTVPAQPDLIHMKWRGIINDAMFDKALKTHGMDEPWRKHIKEAAEVIPGPQDLIHMAVRDVWNPAAVALGKLAEAFPDEFAHWAAKQGLSEEWARKYWEAHWVLPSPNQGFEMLHRDVIGDEALDTLLQALDLAPGWRAPLKAIAFHPYTRVDVRRMHKLGVLSEADVLRAYRDLGYDEEKARGLTDFTLELNRTRGIEDDAELGELSRTAVLGFYEDGLLPRERANALLVSAGHTPEAAGLYLDSVDSTEERRERKTETDLIIELAEAGTLGWDEAQDKLRGLGLETREVERAVTRLLRAQQRKTKLPTKADADKFYAGGLVTKDGYMDLLGRLGYSPKWATMYLALAGEKNGEPA